LTQYLQIIMRWFNIGRRPDSVPSKNPFGYLVVFESNGPITRTDDDIDNNQRVITVIREC
ncbi:MAG: hypothetical protein QNI92_07290, partial [Desulfobacterales bacterium]|nr:hypothetical protein [Desulfobacterales bacterium]